MKSIEKLKPDDAKFVTNMLKIINGTLDTTWGIKVADVKCKGKKKDKVNEYRLCNDNVETGRFKNPLVEQTELKFDESTPVIADVDRVRDVDDGEEEIVNSMDENLEYLMSLEQ